MKSFGWYSSDRNLHFKNSPNCTAFSTPFVPPSVHITLSHVSSAGCSQSSNPPKMHAPVSTPSPPPLLLISLTSYSCTHLLDHSTPVPTPASCNPQLCRCKMKGDYALPPSGPSVWNSLPVHVGNATAIDTFQSAVRPYHSTPKLSESLNSCLIYSLSRSLSHTHTHSLSLSLSLSACVCVCVCARACVYK